MTGPAVQPLDGQAARRWAVTLRAALAARREDIDDLNVFPVPDGDTGTNLYLTLDGAMESLRAPSPDGSLAPIGRLGAATAALTRATLLSARGNSGVILSQLVRGFGEVVAEAGDPDELDAQTFVRAVRRASDLARRSVTRPVEGTILTVAAAAADAAEEAVARGADLHAVTLAALAAARTALDRTPDQLAALARAGVVDAGGAGYVLLLESLERVLSGAGPDDQWWIRRRGRSSAPTVGAGVDAEGGPDGGGPAYEVMYLLEDSSDPAVEVLRDELDRLGDSLLVIGGPEVWNVHVHVDDVGAAVEAGARAGRPHRFAITRFSDQRTGAREHPARAVAGTAIGVVACAAGEGLAALFRASGAEVVTAGPGRRASTGQLLAAARRTDAEHVLLVPGDADTQLAAEAAARVGLDEGLDLQVVRSRSAVQGIAALAVFDAGCSVSDNLLAMTSAAAATRQGALTLADRDALTNAGPCRPGDVLGVIDGDVVCIGEDLLGVGRQVVDRLLGGGGELLTVVTGRGAPASLGPAVAAAARTGRRDLEVSLIEGGQPVHPLLLGVE